MSTLVVPPLEDIPWPTLGGDVCRFIEKYLVFGPGDLRGQPAKLDAEKVGLIHRMYEVYPKGHPNEGRRRFRRVGISLRKGSAKTELAAWLAACELHPNAPVRTIGWDDFGRPIGGGVKDPYIPLIAYTEEQSEELAYGTLYTVLLEGPLRNDFDIGLARITRADGSGRAVALSTAPGARDGARTTFQVFDETHRLILPKHIATHRTMLANLPKRMAADPWSLEVTTAPAPGEGSIAEKTMEYARTIGEGKIDDPKLFFFHRQASDRHDLTDPEGLLDAIAEASGPVGQWSHLASIAEQWQDPEADPQFLERVWLNRPVATSRVAFDVEAWDNLADVGHRPPPGTFITLGFDGARFRDATGLVGCCIETGHLFVLGAWERPANAEEGWEVPAAEVRDAVAQAFEDFEVWRLYADPPYWETVVDGWAGEYGEDRVVKWWTNRLRQVGQAVRDFATAMVTGELTHEGDADLTRHVKNAQKKTLRVRDDEDRPLFAIQKERSDSHRKIDLAMAAVLAWEARGDAVASGAKPKRSVYEEREVRYV